MERFSALKVPFFSSLIQLIASSDQQKNHRIRYWIWLGFIWTSLVLAATNPLWVGAPIAIEQSGRDILLALDLSPSMSNPDMVSGQNAVTRLSLVKMAAQHFIDGRKGDRLGLIVFGEQAYLMTPLTLDHQTLKEMMDDSTAGLAGERTAIGDAIGLGIKRLLAYPKNSRVLILFTDGANNAGAIDPIAAAKEAAKLGIKMYTVGLGANEMMIRDIFGLHPVNPSADLDENSLKEIARLTGGRYFRATDKASLLSALNEMDKLEPSLNDQATYRPQTVLYPIILIGTALLMLIGFLAQLRLNRDRASEINLPDNRLRGLS
jgi:Ca-activated chloride channel family protein